MRVPSHTGVLARKGRHLAGKVIDLTEAGLVRVLALCSWRRRRELARSEQMRPRGDERWFTTSESALVAALASLIVPSDELGPGAREADVVTALDRLLSRSVPRRALYAKGLLGCDEWARREHGRAFVALTPERQLALLRQLDDICTRWPGAGSRMDQLRRRVILRYRAWRCPFFELLPRLVRDVLDAFYTSPVSWEWLGYDGPPMPQGYSDLLERRPPAQEPATHCQAPASRV